MEPKIRLPAAIAWLSLLLFGAVGCGGDPSPSDEVGVVSGTAFYRERIAVPSGARLEVSLEDAAATADGDRLITRIVIAKAGQPPFSFEVPYRREDLDPSRRYVLRARLLDREDLLFETPAPTPVLTQGNPQTVELLLRRVEAGSSD